MENGNLHTLKDLIKIYIEKNQMGEFIHLENIKKDWKLIIGDIAANKINVISLKNGNLKLKSNSSVWRSEFILREKEFIKKINSHYKQEIIKNITFY